METVDDGIISQHILTSLVKDVLTTLPGAKELSWLSRAWMSSTSPTNASARRSLGRGVEVPLDLPLTTSVPLPEPASGEAGSACLAAGLTQSLAAARRRERRQRGGQRESFMMAGMDELSVEQEKR